MKKIVSLLIIVLLSSCKEDKKTTKMQDSIQSKTTKILHTLNPSDFEKKIDGKMTKFYTLTNANGIEVTFTNYGQRLITLYVPDRNGNFTDVVLGPDKLEGFMEPGGAFFGATIGRYGNRIAKGQFELKGKKYSLVGNNNGNHLHGGTKGFNAIVWDVDTHSDNSIVFSRTSPDMEEGYPGNLKVIVSYELTDDNELKISYHASTDKTTIVNLTHHSFFNLAGESSGNVNEHIMMINADAFTPVDEGLIPTGEIRKVENTPFDFRTPKPIGLEIDTDTEQLNYGNGYDHNYVLNSAPVDKEGNVLAAKVIEPESGRTLEVYTNEPGVQFYSGNFLNGTFIGKSKKAYKSRGSFCLETQHFPDSPNNSDFPSTVLEPGEKYYSTCIYKFGVVK
ncbi:galactose-1-epimerase [Kriegella sp. EG-1]|nr:galactose-1-epimerase [Flavobacteriaceae bacterium EG-1]